jgi:hypothetical protein
MSTNNEPRADPIDALLHGRRVFDIDAYGWRNEDEVDQEFIGYAMWALTPPYDHDFDAWQSGTRPQRAPTDQERSLMVWGHDFFGLMKTARHFVGHALVQQPKVQPLRIDSTPFDFSEFAALAALVAAADRLRDFLIVGVLGSKNGSSEQLDEVYNAVRLHGLGEHGDELRALAARLNKTLRDARNAVVHGLATRPAQVQRQLIDRDKHAFETGSWNTATAPVQDFDEMVRQGQATDAQEVAAVENRVSGLCDWYVGLVDVGGRTFQLEYEWRRKRSEQA